MAAEAVAEGEGIVGAGGAAIGAEFAPEGGGLGAEAAGGDAWAVQGRGAASWRRRWRRRSEPGSGTWRRGSGGSCRSRQRRLRRGRRDRRRQRERRPHVVGPSDRRGLYRPIRTVDGLRSRVATLSAYGTGGAAALT